jgi:DNA-binding LacI/PurR family transcriptional regulator/DNA-binding transcriptional regulator YhcF (GntR family)
MTKLAKATEVLRERIRMGIWKVGDRMPSCAELARTCGVSRVTMWRALEILRQESLLHTRGKLIVCGAPPAHGSPATPNEGFAWERLKRRLGAEILSGTLSPHTLYPINKAALHYGVAINTLKRALEELRTEGLLVREGRRYALSSGRTRRHQQELFLISAGDADKGVYVDNPRVEWIVRSFEEECLRSRYTGLCEAYDHAHAGSLLRLSGRVRSPSDPRGFIVNLVDPYSDLYWRRWLDLLDYLAESNLPVILLDPIGGIDLPQHLFRTDRVRMLRISGRRAGEMVGEALIRHGHRRVAYLSPSATSEWGLIRYEGLQKAFREYGPHGSEVEIHSFSERLDAYDLTLAIMGLDKDAVLTVFGERLTKAQAENLAGILERDYHPDLKKLMPRGLVRKTIHTASAFLEDLMSQPHHRWAYDQLLDAVIHIASNVSLGAYTAPFFQSVYEKTSATAWVGSDDKTALLALEFLREHGKKVPEEISVVGFDNWGDALMQGMTTYDFNSGGMVREAMLMIMDDRYRKSRPAVSEVDGFVVERRTTGRAGVLE